MKANRKPNTLGSQLEPFYYYLIYKSNKHKIEKKRQTQAYTQQEKGSLNPDKQRELKDYNSA